MRFDAATNEWVMKLVYSGPGLSGKTTNLNGLRSVFPHLAGDLVAVDLHSERTLRLDLVVGEPLATVASPTRLEILTIPGQNYYAATRKAVLDGADGIVFVADSRREALDENIEAMNEMLNNLRQLGMGDDLPVVVQYNKQDLPTAVKHEQLEPLMNVRSWPSFPGIAIQGNGVADTLRAVVARMLERMPAAPQPAVAVPATWLISCYRCQAMLEVPDARIGAVYTCGVCNASMEVTDTDRGLTRPPANAPREDSAYALQSLPDQNQPALHSVERTPATQLPGLSDPPFVLPGYVIADRLDENVQGQRMRVRDTSGRTQRALVLNAPLMRQPGYREGLDPYVRLAGQVKHPFILPMTGMTQTEEMAVFLSNDPPDYEPLSVILARRRALAPPHAMGILRQLALGLEEAARHGVVHGWLRPDVVLVNPDGAVLLDELCVPKAHRYLIRELSGSSAATEYYLAPEHLGDESRGNIRSDMFVMGAMLFRMLTGEGLVTGYNAHDALHKIATNGPRSLRSVQPGISRDLDQFFQKLVAVERKDRFQTYHELVDLFDRFGGGAQRQSLHLTQRTGATRNDNRPGGTSTVPPTPPMGRGPAPAGNQPRSGTGEFRRPPGGTGSMRRTPTGGGGQPRPTSAPNWNTQPAASSGSGLGLIMVLLGLFAVLAAAAVWYVMAPRSPIEPAPIIPIEPVETPKTTTQPRVKPPLPGWMTPGQVPIDTSAPAPAPAATAAAAAMTATTETTNRIAGLVREEHFQEALLLAEQLPQPELRRQTKDGIINRHDHRRQVLEASLASVPDLLAARNLLAVPANIWGLPGDSEWAKAQLQRVEQNLANRPPPTVAMVPAPPAPPAATATASTLRPDPLVQAYSLVIHNLANSQPVLAQQVLAGLDQSAPETQALRALVGTWSNRPALLNRAITGRGQRLRITNPLTGQAAEITRMDDNGMTLTALDGAALDVGWGRVTLREQIRLCCEVAESPGARSDDLALAVGMQLIGNDPLLASVQLKQSRSGLDMEAVRQLDLLISLGRRCEVAELITRGNAAADAGNSKTLNELIEQLKRTDLGILPTLPDEIQRLEARRDRMASTRAASVLTDRIAFASQDDMNGFSDVVGTWQVANGMACNAGEARLGRRDCVNARGLQVLFMPQAAKGSLMVDFRGARLVIDLGTGSWQMASRRESSAAVPAAIIPRTGNTLLLDYRAADNLIRAELNNGTQSIAVHVDALTDTMLLAANGGAAIGLDEIAIIRMSTRAPVTMSAQASLRQLGWEPLGDAALDPPAIMLPAHSGQRSGIAMPLRDNLAGLSFEVKGTGMLRVCLGKADFTGQWVDVELPGAAAALNLRVAWGAGSLTVADDQGRTIGSTPVNAPPTHVIITALQEATILSTPRPVIK